MSKFYSDPLAASIVDEAMMGEIVRRFDINGIKDELITYNAYKYSDTTLRKGNLIQSLENEFKQTLNQCGEDSPYTEITKNLRHDTYQGLINEMCKMFDLSFNPFTDDLLENDLYTPAFYMFDILLGSYRMYTRDFFVNYLINNYESIYTGMQMDRFKKSKDASSIYNNKMMNNSKMSIIISNLGLVLQNMKCFDFEYENVIDLMFANDVNKRNYFKKLFTPNNDFYKTYICPVIDTVTLQIDIICEMSQNNVYRYLFEEKES